MNPADSDLIRKCLAKDDKAWDEFVSRYSNLIYDAIIRTFDRYGSPSRPDIIADLHNDIFLLIIDHECRVLQQFEGRNGCQLGHYLRTVTIRRTVDFLRKIRPVISLDEEDSHGLLDAASSEREEEPETGLDALVRDEQQQLLCAFMDELENDDRRLCELLSSDGQSPRGIAQTLGITVDYFYVRKKRLLAKLRLMAKMKERETGNA